MKISLCMIVKDEEKFIEMCLENALPNVDEVIIVDTGSTDNTKQIIGKYGDKIKLIEAEWENDFAKSRNLSIEHATGDWILMLDADEKILIYKDLKTIIKENDNVEGFYIPFYNIVNSSDIIFSNVYIKLFKNKYKYKGKIHEQLEVPLEKVRRIGEDEIKIIHFGYINNVYQSKDKSKRNLEILQKELATKTNDPFILYNLGVTYYSMGDYRKSLYYFFKCNENLDTICKGKMTSYESDMLIRITSILNNLGEYNETIKFITDIITEVRNIPEIYYNLGIAYESIGELDEAINAYKMAIEVGENRELISVVGIGSFYPKFRLAQIYEKQDRILDAAMMYIEGVFDKNNILGKGVIETKEFLKRYNLLNILDEFEKIYKS